MPTPQFDRDSLAQWYAKSHLETDPGIDRVLYLPNEAPDREIRFVEINKMIGDRTDDSLEPIDFGIDTGTENAHKLLVLDVTPAQWERIRSHQLPLPHDWSLDKALEFGHQQNRPMALSS